MADVRTPPPPPRRLQVLRRDPGRAQHHLRRGAGGERRPGRSQRRRQDDLVQLRLRAAATRRGRHRLRRDAAVGPADVQAGPAGHRPHLSEGGGVHRHVGARPPDGGGAVTAGRGTALARPPQHEQAEAGRDGAGRGHAGARGHLPPGGHVGQRARAWVTAGWSSWPGRWPPSRRSCWPTSRPRGSTCTRRPRWPPSCARSSVSAARPCSWSSTTWPWSPRWSTGRSSWTSAPCCSQGTFDECMADPAVRDAYLGQMGRA